MHHSVTAILLPPHHVITVELVLLSALKNLNVFHATSDDRSSDKKSLKESLKIFCSMEKPCGKTALISQIMYANKFGEAIEYT